MTERELMQMALDALEHLQTDIEWQYKSPTRAMLRKVEKALRAALAQPESKWVGLTDEEIYEAVENSNSVLVKDMARAIEAKLKEKNNAT